MTVKYLQKMGRSLMIPVACLPICGILMGIGYLLCPAGMQGGQILGIWAKIGYFLCTAGGAVINHMPLLFAIGVGIGMSDGESNGAIAAMVSWLMITTLLSQNVITAVFPVFSENETAYLALSKIDNPFIGILAGLIGAHSIRRFKDTRLPSWLSFFSGKRLGIIMAGLVSIAASAILAFVWPLLFSGLVIVGRKIAGMGYFGSALYATLNRLLIPFGLHHALNNVFWFDTVGIGDLTAFWAGKTSADVGWSLGMYMSGFFPSMMFGVPAAALAMRRSFKKQNRQASAMLMSSAVSSLLCGVTEPFEFMFMFVSPTLYIVYSILFGVFTYIANICGFRAGFSFSGGLIDLIFSSSLPAAQKTLLIIPIGIAAFFVYYAVFRLIIVRFDLKTPGRENQSDESSPEAPAASSDSSGETLRAAGIIRGLGGKSNIVSVANCATRLRVEVKDTSVCRDDAIKAAGAAGVMKLGKTSVQVVIGMEVEFVAEEIRRQLKDGSPALTEPSSVCPKAPAPSAEETVYEVTGASERLSGKCGNAGIAVGRIFLKPEPPRPVLKPIRDTDAEDARFSSALVKVRSDLTDAAKNADPKAAEILDAQAMMLDDQTLIGCIREKIAAGMNAEYAAAEAGNEQAEAFARMDDAYLKARSADMRDVAEKIVLALMGVRNTEAPDGPCIFIAEDLSPEQLSGLNKSDILGIVTRNGSANSHTSILAGNYGIPYLFGVDFDRARIAGTDYAALDTKDGILILSPDAQTQSRLYEKKRSEDSLLSFADSYCGRIKVFANIAKPEDTADVLDVGANGVGLFRTEFLYMNRSTLPDEEEQFNAYKTVLESMNGGDVVIRTMDIGADKKTDCLKQASEENPALGRRAIRICLEDTELFRTQLRALLRAAVYGNEYIMYPMITSPDEIDAINEQLRLAAGELSERQEAYRIPPQGIMIETPAAAMISDILAQKVDFFSIGTNDLTQYTIALDRQAKGLDRFYHPDHEAVMRLIALTVKNAHDKGIWVGVCGEMGGDPQIVPKLRDMGVDELSVSPRKVRAVKSLLSSLPENEPAADTDAGQDAFEEICAPADGVLVPMEQIPDEAFSGGALGKCFGVIPENGNIYAPCPGKITMIADTGHAIGIRSKEGSDVLIHVGINTVTLGGKGFSCHVGIGDTVRKGDLLMTADLAVIKKANLDPTVITAVNR